jgi:hypothetical protein
MALSRKMKILCFSEFLTFLLFSQVVSSKPEETYVTLDPVDGLKVHRGQFKSPGPIGSATFTDYIQKTG